MGKSHARKWFEKFDTIHDASDVEKGRLVFFGDSDIYKWNVPEQFADVPHYQVGVNGAQLLDVLAYAPRCLEKYAPRAIVCVATENDLCRARPVAEIAADFRKFVDILSERKVPLMFFGTKPEPSTTELWRSYREVDALEMNSVRLESGGSVVHSVALEDSKLDGDYVYVDSYSWFWRLQMGTGTPVSDEKPAEYSDGGLYQADGLHLSPAGYAHWERAVRGWEHFLAR